VVKPSRLIHSNSSDPSSTNPFERKTLSNSKRKLFQWKEIKSLHEASMQQKQSAQQPTHIRMAQWQQPVVPSPYYVPPNAGPSPYYVYHHDIYGSRHVYGPSQPYGYPYAHAYPYVHPHEHPYHYHDYAYGRNQVFKAAHPQYYVAQNAQSYQQGYPAPINKGVSPTHQANTSYLPDEYTSYNGHHKSLNEKDTNFYQTNFNDMRMSNLSSMSQRSPIKIKGLRDLEFKVNQVTRKIPSSKDPFDVFNYMIQNRIQWVMTMTKLKPNKGAPKSSSGLYWELVNIIEPEGRKEPLVIRSGNKGTNCHGSHNRIRYALFIMIPPTEEQKQAALNGTLNKNELYDYKQLHITAKRCDNNVVEPAEKIIADKLELFKCYTAIIEQKDETKKSTEDTDEKREYKRSDYCLPVYFVYIALRYDVSQDSTKALTHVLQLRHNNEILIESDVIKFVSGRGPHCVLSKKTHSWEQEMIIHDIEQVSPHCD
jgi:hypothetical protein